MLKLKILFHVALLALLAAACAPVSQQPLPTPIFTENPPVTSVAVVQSLEVQIEENSPLQVKIIVRGQLPDAGCTSISSVDQVRDGNTFKITLMTTTDPLALCALALTPFEQVVVLDISDLPPAKYIVNANGIEQTFELLPRNVSEFQQVLVDALNRRDHNLLKILMGDSFIIGYWLSEGTTNTPDSAIEQLKLNLLNSTSPIIADHSKNLVELLGTDPVTIVGSDVIEASPLFVSGLGAEGKDEAILFVAKLPDGGLYWYGLLFAKDGFEESAPNQPGDTSVYPTSIQYIMAQRDVAIHNGPGNDSGVIGQVFSGQIAKVMGINVDGSWWRIVCPDISLASCWVSAAANLTQPATVPNSYQPAPAPEVIPTFTILEVVQDGSVTIKTHNYPADTKFFVRMGKMGTKGIDGILIDAFNSRKGGSITFTFDIPPRLYGEKQIAIRLESKNGYYSYNWFDNTNTGVGPISTDPLPTNVKYIMAQQDVLIYNGPSKNYKTIGSIAEGQIAKVTGVSADGNWWRVICPDATVGSCWVSAKLKFTKPSDGLWE